MSDVLPCASCPWRVGATPDRIPNYSEAKMECDLATTVGVGDAFRPIMACHLSVDTNEIPCVGYVVSSAGWANLAVRLMVAEGRLDGVAMADACRELEMFDSFADMQANLRRAK